MSAGVPSCRVHYGADVFDIQEFPNGTRLLTAPQAEAQSTCVMVMYAVGSRYEDEVERTEDEWRTRTAFPEGSTFVAETGGDKGSVEGRSFTINVLYRDREARP